MNNSIWPFISFVLIFFFLWKRSQKPDPRSAFLSAAVIWGVILTATTEILSLLNTLSGETLLLSWGLVAVGALVLAAHHTGRFGHVFCRPSGRLPLVELAMILPIIVILAFTGFIAMVGWPNQWDTLVYHLSRIDHWVQNKSIEFYPTHIVRELFNPPWAEFAILHLTQLGGDERFANLPQWFSMVGSLIGVSLIAKHLGATRRGQIFSALVCALIPMGILQASSTQNDYVTAFWLVCLTDAVLAPPRDSLSFGKSVKAGASLGLALLTKGTSYVFVGPIAALMLIGRNKGLVEVLRPLSLIILVALALNASHYLRNFDTFRSPFGPLSPGSPTDVGDSLVNEAFSLPLLASNMVRNVALHVGTSYQDVNALAEIAIEKLHEWLGVDINDSRSTRLYPEPRFRIVGNQSDPDRTGNPLHLVLMMAAILGVIITRRLRTNRLIASYLFALLAGFLLFCLILKWQPWHSRLHLPLFVLWSPIVGIFYENQTKLLIAATLLMTALARIPVTENYLRPLVGERRITQTTRMNQYFPSKAHEQAAYVDAAALLRTHNCTQVGLMIGWDEFEHPLWVLLGDLISDGGRMSHVSVTNSSAHLKNRWPVFRPCSIVSVGYPVEKTLEIDGQLFVQVWSKDKIQVLFSEVRTK